MKTIKLYVTDNAPKNFTGLVEWFDEENLIIEKRFLKDGRIHRKDGPANEDPYGNKEWWLHGNRHRLDGPAIERADGSKYWYIDGIWYPKIDLKDHVVLDQYQGPYNLMWYKVLDKDEIIEYPDIPGLIMK